MNRTDGMTHRGHPYSCAAFLLAICLFSACAPKAVVDTQRAIVQSAAGHRAEEQLRAVFNDRQADLTQMQDDLRRRKAEIEQSKHSGRQVARAP